MLIPAIPRVNAKSGEGAFLPAAGVPKPLLEVDRLKFRYGKRRSLATIFKSREEPLAVMMSALIWSTVKPSVWWANPAAASRPSPISFAGC